MYSEWLLDSKMFIGLIRINRGTYSKIYEKFLGFEELYLVYLSIFNFEYDESMEEFELR